jgi:uncharacterized protein (TIGR01777 family)
MSRPLKIAVSGATGFVASALIPVLKTSGHMIVPLGRDFFAASNPKTLDGVEAVIHLAGDSVASSRWTAEKKSKIISSRMDTTRALCDAMGRMRKPPSVMICASAVGLYGDRGDELLDEESAPGRGFLPEVVAAWEAACAPARNLGIRVINVRFGVIVSPNGGALSKMIPAYRLGLGGRLGSGRQWWSWVSLNDVIGIIEYCLTHDAVRGAVNVVAPSAVRQIEFAQALGRALHRPSIIPMPAMVLKWVLGQMADEMLLASARIIPRRLTDSGYVFRDPELLPALMRMFQAP